MGETPQEGAYGEERHIPEGKSEGYLGEDQMHVYRLESFAPCAKCQVTEPLRCRQRWNFVDPLIQLV